MSVNIVRYRLLAGGAARIGTLADDTVSPLPYTSLAGLWRLGRDELRDRLTTSRPRPGHAVPLADVDLLAPVDAHTEVWACGVTYETSREARVEDSAQAADVYELVYDAERPELFFKSVAWRVAGPGRPIGIREDSTLDVPEPELALVTNRLGEIVGYTVCNDVSSRSIEGENPLYLPQAKVFSGGLRPRSVDHALVEVTDPYALGIELGIERAGTTVGGATPARRRCTAGSRTWSRTCSGATCTRTGPCCRPAPASCRRRRSRWNPTTWSRSRSPASAPCAIPSCAVTCRWRSPSTRRSCDREPRPTHRRGARAGRRADHAGRPGADHVGRHRGRGGTDGPGPPRPLRPAARDGGRGGGTAGGPVATADRETGLGPVRLNGELTRTRFQLELFADVVEDGAYVEATIDHAGDTAMGPRPDLRRLLVPLGPVAVFGASNFPFAFSVPGGDTASALAAGCPVVAKVHDAHPLTSVRSAEALVAGARAAGVSGDVVSLVYGNEAAGDLVRHPAVQAVGFTGSLPVGRMLFDVASARPVPIPFYGELGALNALVVCRAAARDRGLDIGKGLAGSFTLGVGQFCTKPGVALVPAGPDGDALRAALVEAVSALPAGVMLSERTAAGFAGGADGLRAHAGVEVLATGAAAPEHGWWGTPQLLRAGADDLDGPLLDECFGPVLVLVEYGSDDDLTTLVRRFGPALTGTVHADADDREVSTAVFRILESRVGRVVWNGYPTGVAVAWAMHHGGPYPATTSPLHPAWAPRRSVAGCDRSACRTCRTTCCPTTCATPAPTPPRCPDGSTAGSCWGERMTTPTAGTAPTVSLPDRDLADRVRAARPEVDAVVWDGTGDADGLAAVSFAVPPYPGGAWTADQVQRLPALAALQVLSAGYEAWLPLLPANVTLCNGRGIHGASTGELAVTGLLAVIRDFPRLLEQQRAHRWGPGSDRSVAGCEVLVVGAGDVGEHAARVLRALDARVTVVARHAREGVAALTDLAEQVRGVDVLVLAVPLTDTTRGLVDARVLAALPDGAVVVNVARGPVLVTDALLAELSSRRLRAFLDVTDPEPLPAEHALWDAPGLLLSPHVGGGTVGWRDRATALVVDQLQRLHAGAPLAHVVRSADDPSGGTSP